jgi:hypothetical protein
MYLLISVLLHSKISFGAAADFPNGAWKTKCESHQVTTAEFSTKKDEKAWVNTIQIFKDSRCHVPTSAEKNTYKCEELNDGFKCTLKKMEAKKNSRSGFKKVDLLNLESTPSTELKVRFLNSSKNAMDIEITNGDFQRTERYNR